METTGNISVNIGDSSGLLNLVVESEVWERKAAANGSGLTENDLLAVSDESEVWERKAAANASPFTTNEFLKMPDESEVWERKAAAKGSGNDVLVLSDESEVWERKAAANGSGLTENDLLAVSDESEVWERKAAANASPLKESVSLGLSDDSEVWERKAAATFSGETVSSSSGSKSSSVITGYVYDEYYMWHEAGSNAWANFVQPGEAWENPATKRRIHNLLTVSGMIKNLKSIQPRFATVEEITRFHTRDYVDFIRSKNSTGGSAYREDGFDHAFFAKGGFDIASLSAGGVLSAGMLLFAGIW